MYALPAFTSPRQGLDAWSEPAAMARSLRDQVTRSAERMGIRGDDGPPASCLNHAMQGDDLVTPDLSDVVGAARG